MRDLELQPIAAVIAGVLMMGSVGWWAFSSTEVIDPGQPKWQGGKIDDLVAAVPTIDAFEKFYINDENPFVPYALRRPESDRKGNKTAPRTETVVAKTKPLRPPVEVIERTRQPMVLPKISQAGADAPIVYGFVGNVAEQTLLVRMPTAERALQMTIGQKANDWTLIGIYDNNMAHFTDPSGTERRFMIGTGDMAAAPGASANKGSEKNKQNTGDENNEPDNPQMPKPMPKPPIKPTPKVPQQDKGQDKGPRPLPIPIPERQAPLPPRREGPSK
jgi:hypothetical protein